MLANYSLFTVKFSSSGYSIDMYVVLIYNKRDEARQQTASLENQSATDEPDSTWPRPVSLREMRQKASKTIIVSFSIPSGTHSNLTEYAYVCVEHIRL